MARVRAGGMEFWRLPRQGEDPGGVYWTRDPAEAWAEVDQSWAQMVHTELLYHDHIGGVFLEIVGHV